MKTGVSTEPCAVVSRPRRAAPSVARSSKRLTRSAWRSNECEASYDQHRVAVGVEAVAGGDGVAVRAQHGDAAGQVGDEQEQPRARLAENGLQRERPAENEPQSGGDLGEALEHAH